MSEYVLIYSLFFAALPVVLISSFKESHAPFDSLSFHIESLELFKHFDIILKLLSDFPYFLQHLFQYH